MGGQEHEWAELSGCGEQVGRVVGYMSEGAVHGAAALNSRTGDSGRGSGHMQLEGRAVRGSGHNMGATGE